MHSCKAFSQQVKESCGVMFRDSFRGMQFQPDSAKHISKNEVRKTTSSKFFPFSAYSYILTDPCHKLFIDVHSSCAEILQSVNDVEKKLKLYCEASKDIVIFISVTATNHSKEDRLEIICHHTL